MVQVGCVAASLLGSALVSLSGHSGNSGGGRDGGGSGGASSVAAEVGGVDGGVETMVQDSGAGGISEEGGGSWVRCVADKISSRLSFAAPRSTHFPEFGAQRRRCYEAGVLSGRSRSKGRRRSRPNDGHSSLPPARISSMVLCRAIGGSLAFAVGIRCVSRLKVGLGLELGLGLGTIRCVRRVKLPPIQSAPRRSVLESESRRRLRSSPHGCWLLSW